MLIIIDSTSDDLKYALKRDDKFFVERRSEFRELSQEKKEIIDE